MPNVIFNGEPMNGTAAGELIVDVPTWEGPANTIHGNGGNDLVLGDGENFAQNSLAAVNTSRAAAANLDYAGLWSSSTNNPLIDGAGPHTSVYVEPGAGQHRFFSITVGAGQTITADVDAVAGTAWGGYADTIVDILNASGVTVATNNNGPGDFGSFASLDPLVSYTAAAAGTYYIRVRENGAADSYTFEGGEQILLNLSVTGHAATAPAIAGGNDTISGGDGDDTVFGMLGTDFVHGDAGNDRIVSTGDGSYYGDAGSDTIYAGLTFFGETLNGGSGTDTLDTTAFTGDYVVDLATGLTNFTSELFVNFERLVSGAGDDTLTGTAGNNTIDGGAGNDVIDGAGGADAMVGGLGNDEFWVDSAADVVTERTGAGTDTVYASASFALDASAAVETLRTTAQTGTGAIDLGGSEIANLIVGNDGTNVLDGGAGDDRLYGRAGNDTLQGGLGDDLLYGAAGDDQFIVESQGDVVIETPGYGTDLVFALASYALGASASVEILTTLHASTAAIDLTGNGFDQTIEGSNGANVLDGGGGADTLVGFDGDDTYWVDTAADTVAEAAGGGDDRVAATVSYALGAGVEIELLTTDGDVGTAAIDLKGNALANTIRGNDGANLLAGGGGNDTLEGLGGTDILRGSTGRDTLDGGAGNDLVDGGEGAKDSLTGGTGADRFQFRDGDMAATRSLADRITDFSQAESDRIDLHLMDADTGVAGNQAFAFIGSGAFTGTAGQLRTAQAGGSTYLEGDTDGDGTADFSIALTGLVTLAVGDLVL